MDNLFFFFQGKLTQKAKKIAFGKNLKKMSINSRIKEAKSNLEKTVTAS